MFVEAIITINLQLSNKTIHILNTGYLVGLSQGKKYSGPEVKHLVSGFFQMNSI